MTVSIATNSWVFASCAKMISNWMYMGVVTTTLLINVSLIVLQMNVLNARILSL